MKALSLHQPWASLVALGVKSIETRSWKPSPSAIGQPLAIHAAKKVVYGPIGDYYAETWYSNVVHDNFRCYCEADGVGPPCTNGATRTPCLTFREKLVTLLPLGAVVATCTLVDVVSMDDRVPGAGVTHSGRHWAKSPVSTNGWAVWEHELPYGDYSPGRYAWLLANIEPLAEPIPAKGRQGLWEWTAAPDATAV